MLRRGHLLVPPHLEDVQELHRLQADLQLQISFLLNETDVAAAVAAALVAALSLNMRKLLELCQFS